jgi:cobalamin synthase
MGFYGALAAVAVGLLFAVVTTGIRGAHFLAVLIIIGFFVWGAGTLVIMISRKVSAQTKKLRQTPRRRAF